MRTRLVALTLTALALCAGVAYAATAKVTAAGAGPVKLGAKHSTLKAKGLVGRLRKGCELAGPNTRVARLRKPLQGTVELSTTRARRVQRILVTGGATARGVKVGDFQKEVLAAYPKAKVDRSTNAVFGISVVRVPPSGGGPLEFAVSTDGNAVTIIGVPSLSFCD